MKIIIYNNKKTFRLTDMEFKAAKVSWDKKANYWCSRLEAMIGYMFLYAETPEDEIGKKIYLNKAGSRFYKKGDDFFHLLGSRGLMKVEHYNDEMKKKFEKELIPQEDFYNYNGRSPIVLGGGEKQLLK